MASIDFPWSLCTVFADYTVGAESNVRRTPFEDGFIRQAVVSTVALETRSIRFQVTEDNVVAFRDWAKANANNYFNWKDLEDGTVREMRVRGGYASMATLRRLPRVERDGQAVYEGTCILEGSPDAV